MKCQPLFCLEEHSVERRQVVLGKVKVNCECTQVGCCCQKSEPELEREIYSFHKSIW